MEIVVEGDVLGACSMQQIRRVFLCFNGTFRILFCKSSVEYLGQDGLFVFLPQCANRPVIMKAKLNFDSLNQLVTESSTWHNFFCKHANHALMSYFSRILLHRPCIGFKGALAVVVWLDVSLQHTGICCFNGQWMGACSAPVLTQASFRAWAYHISKC
jgi:hypothetical protein